MVRAMPPDKKLYASGEDYLEAILVLHKKMGMVRSVDVARHLEVTKPSVCNAVATLRDGGFLTMDEGYFLHLTDVGREVAEQIYEKHRFFTDSPPCHLPTGTGAACCHHTRSPPASRSWRSG